MIAIVDLSVKKNSHDIFNAGTVVQMQKAYPNEDIIFFADKSHLDCVRQLIETYYKNEIAVKYVAIEYDVISYELIFNRIIEKYGKPCFWVITSFKESRLKELEVMYTNNQEIIGYICLHGVIDLLIDDCFYNNRFPRWKLYSWHLRWAVKKYLNQLRIWHMNSKNQKNLAIEFRQEIINLANLSNVQFIVFSEVYRQYSNCISEKVCNKMIKIWLPYIFNPIKNCEHNGADLNIGVVPSIAADPFEYAFRIIEKVNKTNKDGKIKFVFFRYNYPACFSNCTKWPNDDFSRDNLNRFICNCDYVLQSVPEEKYKLSSSGFAMDVLSQETPLLMFSSHCFDDFMDYKVGYRAYTVEEMVNLIILLSKKDDKGGRTQLSQNIRAFKKQMELDNIKIFRSLIKGIK